MLTPVNGKMCPVNPRFKYDQENHYENKKLVLVREENKEHGLYHYKYTECGYSYVDFDRGDLRYYIYNTMPLYMFDNIQFNGIHGGDSGYGRMESVMAEKYEEEKRHEEEIRQLEIKKYNESPEGKAQIKRNLEREIAEIKQATAVCTVVAKDVESKYNVGEFTGFLSIPGRNIMNDDLYQCLLVYSKQSPYGYFSQEVLSVVINAKTGAYEIRE